MKRSFDGLSKEDLLLLKHWLKLSSKVKKFNCPTMECKNCQRAFPRAAHKLGIDRHCPCQIFPTAYVTKVARQAVAYLEEIK